MALALHTQILLDDTTEVGKWYYTANSLAGGSAQNLRLSTDGVDSFAEVEIGTPPAGAVGFNTYAEMTAATAINGTVAYCFDSDPTKHGRYVRATGTWGGRVGNVQDKVWPDPNHTRIGGGWLELLFQSWSQAADPASPGTKRALPNVTDIAGGEIRITMRAKNLRLGPYAKIVQHVQTEATQQDLWPDTATQRPFVNAIEASNPISDQLFFGTGGLYARNSVAGVHDSGWVEVIVPLVPKASYWHQLGGLEGRQGLDDEPVRYANYVVAHPSEFLGNFTGNMYMCVYHPVVDDESKAVPPSDEDRIRGTLQFKKWELWLPE